MPSQAPWASSRGLGGAVGCVGVVEVGQDVGAPLAQGSAERAQLGQGLGHTFFQGLDHLVHQGPALGRVLGAVAGTRSRWSPRPRAGCRRTAVRGAPTPCRSAARPRFVSAAWPCTGGRGAAGVVRWSPAGCGGGTHRACRRPSATTWNGSMTSVAPGRAPGSR